MQWTTLEIMTTEDDMFLALAEINKLKGMY